MKKLTELGIDPQALMKYITEYGAKVIAAMLIFFIGRIIARIIRNAIKTVLTKSRVDVTLASFISNMAFAVLLSLVVISSINKLGINTTSLAAVVAAAGLAIGLAFQNSLSNIAAGIMIIVLRPFKVGQFIEIGSISGTVTDIDIMTTEMKTVDNKKVIVPNSQITSDKIINHNANNTRRIDLLIGINYADDLKKAKKILDDITSNESRILKTPETFIGVVDLTPLKVQIAIRSWVKTADYDSTRSSILESIRDRFQKEGLTIPLDEDMSSRRKAYAAR
jgi:small conductance mechanosensitive channel